MAVAVPQHLKSTFETTLLYSAVEVSKPSDEQLLNAKIWLGSDGEIVETSPRPDNSRGSVSNTTVEIERLSVTCVRCRRGLTYHSEQRFARQERGNKPSSNHEGLFGSL